ncbi:hypothetical protein I6F35_28335 [Bradyrhizobium sp. BRP22]|uniref:hypothetical protein n=1 Tax=Bradyrhizobium sp. BRP22 TaxID=2793821 RepID=UPI001CD305C3|nr:hypothetical protein [Bradyrhizobium sp. BRP22]MCA1457080.1 hypothetical protein [Bradyrhizobium sp. BRP22]
MSQMRRPAFVIAYGPISGYDDQSAWMIDTLPIHQWTAPRKLQVFAFPRSLGRGIADSLPNE